MDPYTSLRGRGRRSLRAELLHRINQGKFRLKDLPCSYSTGKGFVDEFGGEYVFIVEKDFWGNQVWKLGLDGEKEMEEMAAETRFEVDRVLGVDIADTGWLYADWPEPRRRYDRDDTDVRKLHEAIEAVEWN